MHVFEIFLILCLNAILILVMQNWQGRSLKQRINNFKQEILELEDLVAAIIEEFEEIAEMVQLNRKEVAGIESAPEPEQKQEQMSTELESLKKESPATKVSGSKHQMIFDLSNQGLADEEIAKKLGIGRGEVSLILGLYRRS